MFLRLRILGVEVLALDLGDEAADAGESERDVATGAADLTLAEPAPVGFGLPDHPHD